jgi:hypothetical protein
MRCWNARCDSYSCSVDCVWNVMAHAQKPDFVFPQNGSARGSVQSTTGRRAVHISLQGLYCSSEPVFCSHVTLILVTLSILLFALHFSTRASSCAITFQTQSTTEYSTFVVKKSYLCHRSANELLTFWCSWCPFNELCSELSTNIWRNQFEGVTGLSDQYVYREQDAVRTMIKTSSPFILRIPYIIENQFTTLYKQNVQICSLDIYITISHWIFYSYRNSQQDATVYQNLLFHVYMKLSTFRATHHPSSGAQNCTSSPWFCIRERLLDDEVAGRWQRSTNIMNVPCFGLQGTIVRVSNQNNAA